MNYSLLLIGLLSISHLSLAADELLSPTAPKDKPVETTDIAQFKKDIAPYVAKAKSTYPRAKQRFLAGLPRGQIFFLTVPLRDDQGREENVFVAVRSIHDGIVSGRIWNDVRLVRGYKNGDDYSFPESAIIDWLIARPDGTEEGNFVGKFLDTYNAR